MRRRQSIRCNCVSSIVFVEYIFSNETKDLLLLFVLIFSKKLIILFISQVLFLYKSITILAVLDVLIFYIRHLRSQEHQKAHQLFRCLWYALRDKKLPASRETIDQNTNSPSLAPMRPIESRTCDRIFCFADENILVCIVNSHRFKELLRHSGFELNR